MRQTSLSNLGSGVMVTLWSTCSVLQFVESVLLLMLWPLAMLLFAAAVVTAATGLRQVWERRDRIARAGLARGLALAVIASASIGAVGAMTPSLGHYGERPATLSLSPLVAPLFLAVIAVCALRVLRSPSPRRLAELALAGVVAWPFLMAIRALRGMNSEYFLVEPGPMWMFSFGTIAISGLVLASGVLAWRAAAVAVAAPPAARAIRTR